MEANESAGSTAMDNGKPEDVHEAVADGVRAAEQERVRDPGMGPAPHDVERVPGLPEDAPRRAAEHINDPETQRGIAYETGRRLHPIPGDYLFDGGHVDELYDGLKGIRRGAVLQPPQREAAELLKVIDGAPTDMAGEVARGQADLERAARLLQDKRPELVEAVEETEAEVEALEGSLDQAEADVDDALRAAGDLEAHRRAAEAEDAKRSTTSAPAERDRRSVFELLPISPKMLAIVAPVEIATSTLLLQGPISDMVATTTPVDSYLISAGVSTALLGLGLVAGYVAVALHLPTRLAGLLCVLLCAWLLSRGATDMDLIRMDDENGVKLLTTATMATIVIAGVTAYATTRYKAYRAISQEPDVLTVLGEIGVRLPIDHPVTVPLRVRDRIEAKLAAKRTELRERKGALAKLDEMLDALRTSYEQTPRRVLAAKKVGIEAEAEAAGLVAVTETALAQEEAHTEAAKAAVRIGHSLVRAEEIPEEPPLDSRLDVRVYGSRPEGEEDTAWQKRLAIAVLAAGLVPAVLIPSIPAGVAGALVAAGLWPLRAIRRRGGGAQAQVALDQRPPIESPAGEEDPFWRYQPSRTRSKWRRGETAPTERE
ncbi:MAG TPA: hypothetical protein VF715_01290 [Thermoleophilaceae bacterium]|jgi:hypothetical protein